MIRGWLPIQMKSKLDAEIAGLVKIAKDALGDAPSPDTVWRRYRWSDEIVDDTGFVCWRDPDRDRRSHGLDGRCIEFCTAVMVRPYDEPLATCTGTSLGQPPSISPPQHLRLAPTARSRLQHVEPIGYTTERTGDVHDFDFIAGSWNIANYRLAERGVGCTQWEQFPSTSHGVLHLGGIANVDEIRFRPRDSPE